MEPNLNQTLSPSLPRENLRDCPLSGRNHQAGGCRKWAATFDGLRSKERRAKRHWDEHHERRIAEQTQHFDIDRPEAIR